MIEANVAIAERASGDRALRVQDQNGSNDSWKLILICSLIVIFTIYLSVQMILLDELMNYVYNLVYFVSS